MQGKVMQGRHKAIVFVAAFGATILAALIGAANADEVPAGQHPNNRANHHPLHESVRENQAFVTRLGSNVTAVSYWASTAQGWQVLTTVDTVSGQDTDAEQHAIVRFSATLAPGQEQLISIPVAIGEDALALRIRRQGDHIEMERVADPSM
jgi:hypothetical protein